MIQLSAQTKVLLTAFSSVIVLVLIGSAIYKGWYFNTFSTSTQEQIPAVQTDQKKSVTIKLVPSEPTVSVGESITYSLMPAEDLELSAFGIRLLIAGDATNTLDMPEAFALEAIENSEVILNTIEVDEDGQRYGELAIITTNPQQNPLIFLADQPIADFALTIPNSSFDASSTFLIDSEPSMAISLDEEPALIQLTVEPVTITE